MSKPIYGYWNLRGISQPIRLMIAYLELDVEEKRYGLDQAGYDEWSNVDKINTNLTFPNLPYWKENGWNLTETLAIMRYLAREKGNKDLMPTKAEQVRETDMLEHFLYDIWFTLIRRCYVDIEENKINLKENMPKKLEYLSNFLAEKKFIIGDKLAYVDFLMYEVISQYTIYDPDFIKPFPNLEKYKKNFEAIPAMAKYMNSSDFIKSPCFHPMFVKHKM